MKTIYEISKPGLRALTPPISEAPSYRLPAELTREKLLLPSVSEPMLARHYTALSKRSFGVDDGFYPLGSCTMKYNPKLHEEIAALEGFAYAHPLAPIDSIQGSLEVIDALSAVLAEITGMDAVSLQPCAGAHGEYTGLLVIDKYHKSRGDYGRRTIIVPDSAHGTNPASAAMAGFDVVSVPSDADKGVDLDALKSAVGEDTAALMLTNPTTLGLFERNIVAIAQIVHDAGGLLYYDGANLNAVMGIVRPGDTGFDVVHLNLHKTFSTPHGGGGPGSGPVGCKRALERFLPSPRVVKDADGYRFDYEAESIGKVTTFYGNFGVYVKALAYILTLGDEGLRAAAETAVLNANYLRASICDNYPTDLGRYCMHEFVVSLGELKEKTGVGALDVAKAMIDCGIHPPTMYFPLIVKEALMFEPTETETKESLDAAASLLNALIERARSAPDELHAAPVGAAVGRPDEAKAARNPVVRG